MTPCFQSFRNVYQASTRDTTKHVENIHLNLMVEKKINIRVCSILGRVIGTFLYVNHCNIFFKIGVTLVFLQMGK